MTATTEPTAPPAGRRSARSAPARTKNVHQAIAEAMAEVRAVGKRGRNAEQGYMFKKIDDFMTAANEAMAKAGVHQVPRVLTRIVNDSDYRTSTNKVQRWVDLEVEFTFYGPDGSSVAALVWGEARDSADKATNKALTAAQKYALMYVLMIPTEDIQDGDQDNPEAQASTGESGRRPASAADVARAKLLELVAKRAWAPLRVATLYKDQFGEVLQATENAQHIIDYTASLEKDGLPELAPDGTVAAVGEGSQDIATDEPA